MAPCRRVFYFVFALFSILVSLVCETCRLDLGKYRKVCMEEEKIDGYFKLNFFYCQQRVSYTRPALFLT
uniref:Secreted protein n=1 Tax=Castor canadensis TaxID=51338 RepID=A0A8C0WL17_CASCN